MSLLTIGQNVAREIPIAVPSGISNSSNDSAKLILACANKTGKELSRAKGANGYFDQIVTEYTFSTVDSQEDYDLPSDYHDMLDNTVWDRSNYWKMRGALSPGQWQQVQSSVLGDSVTIRLRYRIRNVGGERKFSIDPIPSSIDNLVYEYVSKNWAKNASGTSLAAFSNDSDEAYIDEWLIELGTLWRVLNRMGMEYREEKAQYYVEFQKALAQVGGGAEKINLSNKTTIDLIGCHNIPDTGYGQ